MYTHPNRIPDSVAIAHHLMMIITGLVMNYSVDDHELDAPDNYNTVYNLGANATHIYTL